jgi:hypothetical protein
MKLFEYILSESLHTKTREAKDILMASGMAEKEAHTLALKIEGDDPYKDAGKLFTPVMANWLANKIVQSYDEHLYDIRKYKENRKKLTSAEVTTANFEKKKKLLGSKPEDFMGHYSDLQEWNKECEAIFDDGKSDNSAKEIEVAKHNGYTMYKIDKEKHLEIPLVKNKMNWCVTTHKRDRGHYGNYGGPPYYAIMKDSDNSQFAMIIPKHFNEDPDQAVRDADNRNRLSPSNMKKVRPLIQMVLNPKKHTHPYINAIYDIKVKPPINPTPEDVLKYISDNAIELGEWKEGEDIMAKDSERSLEYARHLGPGKRFEKGEDAIAEEAWSSLRYAEHLGPGKRFEKGEDDIAKDAEYSLEYAQHLGPGKRFEKGEGAISEYVIESLQYAKHLGPGERFGKGEDVISKNVGASIQYAQHLGPGKRFEKGEDTIAKFSGRSLVYAEHLGPGKRFEKGEDAIAKEPWESVEYAKHLGPGKRFEKGENAIAKISDYSLDYAIHLGPGKRFEKGEDAIAEDPFVSLEYAQHLGPEKRFEKGENIIAQFADASIIYAKHIKSRFKLGEKEIKESGLWRTYKSDLRLMGIEPPDNPWKPGDPE